MTLFLICTYCLGVFVGLYYIPISAFYLILICVLIVLSLLYKCSYQGFFTLFLYQILFFTLGIALSLLHYKINNTTIIKENIAFKSVFAEIVKVEKSHYSNKSFIFVNNLIVMGQDSIPSDSTFKLSYSKNHNLAVGDIVSMTVFIFPPSKPLSPYGFNFFDNAFFKGISGTGYIVGNINVLENVYQNSLNNTWKYYLGQIKTYFINNIKKYTSSESSPFLIAISLGEYNFLPKKDLENMRHAGLSHLIAISGFHISLIAGFLFFIIRRIVSLIKPIALNYDSKNIASIITILILTIYLCVLDFPTPAFRAFIMTTAFLIAILFNIKAISINSLFLAGVILITINPYIMFSAGFLLSFFATLTIILFYNSSILQKYYYVKYNPIVKTAIIIIVSICMTVAIEVMIAPILIYFFGSIPMLGSIANIIASPIFTFILMPALLGYFISPIFIGKYFLILADYAMHWILKIAEFTQTLQYGNFYIDFMPQYILASFLLLFIGFALVNNAWRYCFLALMPCIIFLYFITYRTPDILIDYNQNLVAIKNNNNQYLASNIKEKFIISMWFKNPKTIANIQDLYQSSIGQCNDFHCIINANNKIISYSANPSYFYEDCGEVDIIVAKFHAPIMCTKSLVIDKTFINQHGSTFIYFNENKIKIVPNS